MIAAVLVWYDEPPELLLETVESWGQLCGGLIAVDGRFHDFPGTEINSPLDQVEAIHEGALRGGMRARVVQPTRTWADHPEKRSHALYEARETFPEASWYLLPDADEELVVEHHTAAYARDLLIRTHARTATVTAEIEGQSGWQVVKTKVRQRRLMRSLPGLRVEGQHYRYVADGGLVLWAEPGTDQEPAMLTNLLLKHRRDERPPERLEAAKVYYRDRGWETAS